MPLVIQALGQAGFVLRAGPTALVIDPYLSNSVEESGEAAPGLFERRFPPPVLPAALSDVAVVLVTHAHGDHCDRETLLPLAEASPEARFWGPYPVVARLREWGIAPRRIVEVEVGRGMAAARGCIITALPSAHYGFDPNTAGEPAYVGYVVELDGITLYHSGDTIRYAGMAERLHTVGVDVAILPVNGRDAERERLGIVGNLEPEEAMRLAADAGASVIVPMHNDLFASNVRSPEEVDAAWRRCGERPHLRLLRQGETWACSLDG